MCLEGTALVEINERMTNTLFCLYMNFKKKEETTPKQKHELKENETVGCVLGGKTWEVRQKVQISSYKVNKL